MGVGGMWGERGVGERDKQGLREPTGRLCEGS